jgi:hypothetical protein
MFEIEIDEYRMNIIRALQKEIEDLENKLLSEEEPNVIDYYIDEIADCKYRIDIWTITAIRIVINKEA